MAQSLPSTLLSSLPSGLGTLPSLVSTLPSQLSSLIPGLPSWPWSSLWPRSSFWFGSHGPVLTFYPSFISPFRSWNITLIGKYTSFPTVQPHPWSSFWSFGLFLLVWQPWPSPCLLPFFHLSLQALEHYPHW